MDFGAFYNGQNTGVAIFQVEGVYCSPVPLLFPVLETRDRSNTSLNFELELKIN